MVNSQIIYNGKTISFGVAPREISVNPVVPRTVNTTLTGAQEVLSLPRIDIYVAADYADLCSASLTKYGITASTLRVQLDNWWQWAIRGNSWDYTIDSTKKVRTTLAGDEAANDSVIDVASASGITQNGRYVLIDGPNYQMVTVTNIAGTSLTISPALDYAFSSGSLFRDVYYWSGQIRDSNQDCPIVDAGVDKLVTTGLPVNQFDFRLRFIEAP